MLRVVFVSLVLLGASAADVDAQRPRERGGLWVEVAPSIGSVKASCSICDGRATGPSIGAKVGGAMAPKLRVGAGVTGWLQNGADSDRSLMMLTALGVFYPSTNGGLHFEAGIGGYWYVEEDATQRLTSEGLALHVGAGFDLRIARGVSLSPFGSFMASGFGNPNRLDKATGASLPLLSDMTVRVLQLGVAATLH